MRAQIVAFILLIIDIVYHVTADESDSPLWYIVVNVIFTRMFYHLMKSLLLFAFYVFILDPVLFFSRMWFKKMQLLAYPLLFLFAVMLMDYLIHAETYDWDSLLHFMDENMGRYRFPLRMCFIFFVAFEVVLAALLIPDQDERRPPA